MKNIFILFSLFLVLTSCFPNAQATIEEDIVSLENTKWELIRPKDLNATLTFNNEATKVSGYNGCNDYQAEIKKKNYQLEFGIFTTTEKYCEEFANVEEEYMKSLAQVNDYLLSGNKLQLKRGNTTLLTFKEIKE